MSPALAAILERHSLREALVASYLASRRNGVALNAASLAGRALEQHNGTDAALESIRALRRELREGREDMPLSEDEWDLVGASAYIRKVRVEEGGSLADRPSYVPGRSDEGDSR